MCAKSKQMKVHTQIHKYFKVYKNIASEGKKITHPVFRGLHHECLEAILRKS